MQDIAITSIVLGTLIPIIFLTGGVIIALVAINRRHKLRMMEHQERLLAIEKGQPIPVVPDPVRSKNNHHFAWPFVLIGLGLALFLIYLFGEGDSDALAFGLISFFIGSGLFLSRYYEAKKQNGKHDDDTASLDRKIAAADIPESRPDAEPTVARPATPPSGEYGKSKEQETGS